MISMDEYCKMKAEERAAARAEAEKQKPREGGVIEYLRKLREEHERARDEVTYLALKAVHEDKLKEQAAEEERAAEAARETENQKNTDAAYRSFLARMSQ